MPCIYFEDDILNSGILTLFICYVCSLSLNIFPLAAFIVERLAQQKCISERVSGLATSH